MQPVEITLHGRRAAGRIALIDAEDLELVSAYRWHLWEQKNRPRRPSSGPYACANARGEDGQSKRISMHALITGWPRVDHVNHNGLDNRRDNLRPTTNARNSYNQRPQRGTSSRFKGVSWHKRIGKWRAAIKVDGTNRHLGVFVSEEEAALAYNAAALEAFGEYACLNEVAA